jgi:hypothetical protein
VKLGHVSLDGTKAKANASKHKAIVEPVFGQIKEVRGFRRFSLRELGNVISEWDHDMPDAQSFEAVS